MPTKCFLIETIGERLSEFVYSCSNSACSFADHIRLPTDPESTLGHAPERLCPSARCRKPMSVGQHTWNLWRNVVTGATHSRLQDFGPGAMFDAPWLPEEWRGQDGQAMSVILPNGHVWHIDSQAANCTRKGEDHDCWCRHGEPPMLTVDKNPEPGRSTCEAGSGSIKWG